MELLQTSLIDGLAEGHLVRQWWERRLVCGSDMHPWPDRPDGDRLDSLREGAGQGRVDRHLLMEVLRGQYSDSDMELPSRLESLALGDARTVTTGHQLCLAMGPAFTVYKALTAIHLADWLENRWGTPVVPVFWLASEDHDFEEVSALWDGADWHRWTPEESGGPVGRMDAAGSAETLSRWGSGAGLTGDRMADILAAADGSLSDAMRRWIHGAIGPDRIVVLDGDDPRLKSSFSARMIREVREGVLFREVSRVNAVLESQGHSPQVHVRGTNLFHLGEGTRNRLVKEDDGWIAGSRSWESTEALLDNLAAEPQAFSPNALFRPVYQAFLLPDVAVVGGLAEVAYWLQLSGAFAAFGLRAPSLVPRDGARVSSAPWTILAGKLGVRTEDLGGTLEAWESRWMEGRDVPDVQPWRDAIDREAEGAMARFTAMDVTLEGSVEAARAKMVKLLDKLEGQGRRAVRRQQPEEIGELARLHAWLHPDGKPQERVANFHALSVAWTGKESLEEAVERAFIDGHDGKDWRPLLHDLLDGPC